MFRFPFPPPRPPLPGESLFPEEEEEEDVENEETSREFIGKMKSKGFDPELINMGLKVAKNHMRPPEEAYRIGENYIREMAK